MPSALEFNGKLSADAPGLFARLNATFGPENLPLFELAYLHSFRNGGTQEILTTRDLGASFNPRPARICKILLSESVERSPAVLAAAILSSTTVSCLEGSLTSANYISEQCQAFLNRRVTSPQDGEAVALAWTLDALRHLHLGTPDEQSRREFMTFSQTWVLPGCLRAETERLRTLVTAAHERLQHILEA